METHSGPHPDADSREPYDPREALADAEATRAAVADRLITPWWYHPALGAMLAAIVLVLALDLNVVARLVVAVACIIVTVALIIAYQRVTGLWVGVGSLGPRSIKWWGAYIALVIIVMVIAMGPSYTSLELPAWVPVLLAAVIFAGTVFLGRNMDEAMRGELRNGTASAPRVKK